MDLLLKVKPIPRSALIYQHDEFTLLLNLGLFQDEKLANPPESSITKLGYAINLSNRPKSADIVGYCYSVTLRLRVRTDLPLRRENVRTLEVCSMRKQDQTASGSEIHGLFLLRISNEFRTAQAR